jgi:hypothetical protein
MLNRRTLLATAGQLLLLTGSRVTAHASESDPTAPWRAAPAAAHPDRRIRAAGWAVLAPNPHNRQPWLLDLVGSDTVLLRCDLDRRLPETDPFDRQITIGLGAFAELFRMAVAAEGFALEISAFPEGEPQPRLDARPVARFRLAGPGSSPDPLFAQAPFRRSAKGAFDPGRAPDQAMLAALVAAAGPGLHATVDPVRVAALRALTWHAWLTEARTPAAHRETVDLLRLGRAAIAAQPDGVPVAGPGIDPLIAQGVLTRESFAEPGRPGYEAMVGRYEPILAATAAYVWTVTPGATRAEAFAAGRQWLRLNLAATGLGLALHPVSQALQEYPAMAPRLDAMRRLLSVEGPATVQMLGRIGFLPEGTPAPAPTPRWPAASSIRNA